MTRIVVLTRRYAIKIPRFYGKCFPNWRTFLYGLLGNMQERMISKLSVDGVCPVVFSIPGGWLLVMPRCVPLEERLSDDEYRAFVDRDEYMIPVENKASSFGWLDGKLVAIDYGS